MNKVDPHYSVSEVSYLSISFSWTPLNLNPTIPVPTAVRGRHPQSLSMDSLSNDGRKPPCRSGHGLADAREARAAKQPDSALTESEDGGVRGSASYGGYLVSGRGWSGGPRFQIQMAELEGRGAGLVAGRDRAPRRALPRTDRERGGEGGRKGGRERERERLVNYTINAMPPKRGPCEISAGQA